jgi:electron transfer flavoprotein beta subunit
MEILVCVKQVPDDSVAVHLKQGTQKVNLEGITAVVNAFDTYALEMAVRLKEAVGGTVTVVTIGGEETKSAVKDCLAVGADQGFLVSDPSFAGADMLGKSRILAAAAKYLEKVSGKPFDIIFCGREATDHANGQVGCQLAETLGVGIVTDLVDIEKTKAGVCCRKQTEEGYLRIESPCPCVVTVSKPAYDPRYPTIKSKLAARRMSIPVLTLEQLGNIPVQRHGFCTVKVFEPPKRKAGVKIQEEDSSDSAQKAIKMMVDAKLL